MNVILALAVGIAAASLSREPSARAQGPSCARPSYEDSESGSERGGGAPRTNSEPDRLEFLVGEWKVGEGKGGASYRWDVGHCWLVWESHIDVPGLGPYEVNGVVTVDRESGRYRAWAFNSLGMVIEYEGGWNDEETLVFLARGGQARLRYKKLPGGRVRLISEQAAQDGTFRVLFEAVLSR